MFPAAADMAGEPGGQSLPSGIGAIKITLSAAALVCAGLSAVAAFGQSYGRQMPEAALNLWPRNGEVFARASQRMVAIAQSDGSQTIDKQLLNRARGLALRGLILEPMSVEALATLGYVEAANGQRDRARKLMLAGAALSRRNTAIDLWLSEDAARRGDDMGALRSFDAAIRTSTSAANTLLPMMAAALAKPGAPAAFEQILSLDPPWSEGFWTAVLSAPSDLTNSYELRLRLHRRKVPLAPSHDALLIQRLAQAGKLDEAFTLYEAAGGRAPEQHELLHDPDFSADPRFAPIHWKIEENPSYSSAIDRDDGVLVIGALEDAEGPIAQQLVRIRPGRYRLDVRYGKNSAEDAPLAVRIACAELGGERTLNKAFSAKRSGVQIVDIIGPCRFAWLTVELVPGANADGVDTALDRVSLREITS